MMAAQVDDVKPEIVHPGQWGVEDIRKRGRRGKKRVASLIFTIDDGTVLYHAVVDAGRL